MSDLKRRCALLGPERLADAELLALILNQPGLDVPMALLDTHGDLASLSASSAAVLQQTPGVGPARAVQLVAALEAGRRALYSHTPRPNILTAADAFAVLYPEAGARPHEALWALYLNRRKALLAIRRLTVGSDAHTIVDPRQVLRPAVQLGAAALIVAHNHPSGDPDPSAQDIAVTRRLVQAASVVGVEVLDHLILGTGCYVSLAERRLIDATPVAPTLFRS